MHMNFTMDENAVREIVHHFNGNFLAKIEAGVAAFLVIMLVLNHSTGAVIAYAAAFAALQIFACFSMRRAVSLNIRRIFGTGSRRINWHYDFEEAQLQARNLTAGKAFSAEYEQFISYFETRHYAAAVMDGGQFVAFDREQARQIKVRDFMAQRGAFGRK
jgi:hypothetical protein